MILRKRHANATKVEVYVLGVLSICVCVAYTQIDKKNPSTKQILVLDMMSESIYIVQMTFIQKNHENEKY